MKLITKVVIVYYAILSVLLLFQGLIFEGRLSMFLVVCISYLATVLLYVRKESYDEITLACLKKAIVAFAIALSILQILTLLPNFGKWYYGFDEFPALFLYPLLIFLVLWYRVFFSEQIVKVSKNFKTAWYYILGPVTQISFIAFASGRLHEPPLFVILLLFFPTISTVVLYYSFKAKERESFLITIAFSVIILCSLFNCCPAGIFTVVGILSILQPAFVFPLALLVAEKIRRKKEYEEMKEKAIKIIEELIG